MLGAAVAILSSPVGTKALNQGIGLLVRGSWKKVIDFYSEKYGADPEIQKVSHDLDVKLKIIQLPLDICAQHVAKGNQAMEGARDVAVAILKEIDDLSQDITNFNIREVRKEPHPDGMQTPVQWARRLKNLRERLDSLIPYLNLAITAATLSSTSVKDLPRISRLLWASEQITNAKNQCKAETTTVRIYCLEQMSFLKLGRKTWETKFMDCQIILNLHWVSKTDSEDHPYSYSLTILEIFPDDDKPSTPSEEDTAESEEEEEVHSGEVIILLEKVMQLNWSTSQAIGLTEADLTPALIIQTRPNKTAEEESRNCAFQCRFDTNQEKTKEDNVDDVQREWETLGRLEYLLHLTLLETIHSKSHTTLQDSMVLSEFGQRSEIDGDCNLGLLETEMSNISIMK